MESVNATGWKPLKRRLASTSAQVLLAQETWTGSSRIPQASAWARRRGWKSLWAPAVRGSGGGMSGGVAIFVRDYLGLRLPQVGDYVWHEARAVAGILEAPGFRPFFIASIYLHSGDGPGARNLAVLSDIGKAIREQGEDWQIIFGGDLNMTPEDLLATGFDREVEASVVYPPTCRGTFRTAKVASLIDFFIISDRLSAAIDEVRTVEATGVKGHTPIMLKFRPKVTSVKALHIRKPPAMELERVYGPILPPPCWRQAREKAEEALAAARDNAEDAEDLLEAAYAAGGRRRNRGPQLHRHDDKEEGPPRESTQTGVAIRHPGSCSRQGLPQRGGPIMAEGSGNGDSTRCRTRGQVDTPPRR